jgi:hypothetical protein
MGAIPREIINSLISEAANVFPKKSAAEVERELWEAVELSEAHYQKTRTLSLEEQRRLKQLSAQFHKLPSSLGLIF